MFLTVILFAVSIIASITSAILQNKSDKPNKAGLYTAAFSGLLSVTAVFVSQNDWRYAAFAVFIANALICLPDLYLKSKTVSSGKAETSQLSRSLCIAAALILLLEVFVCNFGTFRLSYPSAPSEQQLSISKARVNGAPFYSDTVTLNAGESISLSFDSVNSEVDTIYADVDINGDTSGTIDVAYSDETNAAGLRRDAHLNYIQNNELSKYITCSFSGTVSQLEFSLRAPSEGSLTLSSLYINKHIPFQFSWIRVVTLFIIVSFVIILVKSPKMKKAYQDSPNTFKISTIAVTSLCLVLCCFLVLLRGDGIFELFDNPDTHQMNKELVDAFSAGQVNLLDEPSKELLDLSNPYDNSLRSAKGVGAAWDHLLYDGKYYSYYGIGTVLTLFLPYHLITGDYFPSLWATFLYSMLGILFLSLAYYVFIKRLFPKITNGIAVSGLVIVQASSFIWYCVTIENFYELAQVSGFTFLIAGMFFLLRSGVVGNGKISRVNICIATILFSIAVLCRAAVALYCIVSLLFIAAGVQKIVRTSKEKTYRANKKPIITFLLAALIPYVCIGSIQMIYNYLRFGSVLDFGIEYTLTIYDYQHIQFHLPLVLIAVYNYLFTLPKLSSEFPFLTSNYVSLSVNGYYFLAGFSAAGLIFRAFPVLSFLGGPKAYRLSKDNGNRKLAAAIIISGCLIIPLIQMAMIWQYGYTPRYAVDFAWEMLFGAFVILFTRYASASQPVKNILYKFLIVSAVFSAILNFALTYEFVLDYGNLYKQIPEDIRSNMLSFGRLFEFWNIM